MTPFFRSTPFFRNAQTAIPGQSACEPVSQKKLSRKTGAPGRTASESPTFVAFTLALFVFLSAISMMTAAQTGLADEASLRATPVAYHQSALVSGSIGREDDCCDDAVVTPIYLMAAFDYASQSARPLIGRKDVLARNFDARGPPARSERGFTA